MKQIFTKNRFVLLLAALFSTYTLYEKFIAAEISIPMIVSILFIVLFLVFRKIDSDISIVKSYDKFSYSLFALFMVIGDSFKQYNSLFGIYGNPFYNTDTLEKLFEDFAPFFGFLNGIAGNILMCLSAICKSIGYYFIIKYFIEWLKKVYISLSKKEIKNNTYIKLTDKLFSGNSFIKIFLIILIAWLPYLIIKFPGSLSNDAQTQILQFFGEKKLTTHHPFFSTLLIGGCMKSGMILGNKSIGIFLYIILQYTFAAGVFAYCVATVSKFKISKIYAWCMLAFYSLSVVFPIYTTSVVKDTLYCTLIVLYILWLTLFIKKIKNQDSFTKELITLAILSLFVALTRNNGIYCVIPTLIAIGIIILLSKNQHRATAIAILTLPLILFFGFNLLQYQVLGIEKGSIAEMLSIPFQQTARYVRDYPDEVTADEAATINKVLNYDEIAERYTPTCSDKVKETYKNNDNILPEYFSIWLNQFKKHPLTYIEATINTSYIAFYPDIPNTRAYTIISKKSGQIGGIFSLLRIMLQAVAMGLSAIPVVSLIINPVFYIWLLIYLAVRELFKKHFLNFAIFIPLLIHLPIIIAGPAVYNHPRYLYPIYWAIIIPLLYLTSEKEVYDSE